MVLSQVLNVYFLFEKPGLGTGIWGNGKRGQGRGGQRELEKGENKTGLQKAAEGRTGKRQLGEAGGVWVG